MSCTCYLCSSCASADLNYCNKACGKSVSLAEKQAIGHDKVGQGARHQIGGFYSTDAH